jgi:glycerol-3-phosphate O-acyltransferase
MIFSYSKALQNFLTKIFFSRLVFSESDKAKLLEITSKGVPLYILKASNEIDYLLLKHILRENNLPEPEYTFPEESFFINPGKFINNMSSKLLFGLGEDHLSFVLSQSLINGKSGAISLFSPGTIMNPGDKPKAKKGLYHIISQIKKKDLKKPIYAIPIVSIWDRKGIRDEFEKFKITNRIFGHKETPNRLRMLYQVFGSLVKPEVKLGEPLNINEFVKGNLNENISETTEKLRWELVERIETVWRYLLGPKLQNVEKVRRDLAHNPEIMKTYYEVVNNGMLPKNAVKEIKHTLKELPAAPHAQSLSIYNHGLRFLWYKLYKGFDLNNNGFDAMREASKKGSLLLLPCHRSHVDYLILSWLMQQYKLPIPHIAAGRNLSFWPMGPIFRRGGAFFIRRTFRGNNLYKTIVVEYLTNLFKKGINVEFFIEGTRSRTGKVVYPKLGFLGIISKLVVEKKIPSPQIVPISIGYERIIEEKSYSDEMLGQTKKSENITQLLKAGKVVLNHYGKVNVRISKPFDMAEFIGDLSVGSEPYKKRIEQLALVIIRDIVSNTVVTPSMIGAASLLASGKNIISKKQYYKNFLFFRNLAVSFNIFLSTSLKDENRIKKTMSQTLNRLNVKVSGENIIIQDNKRSSLAYYRNGYLQIIISLSLTAQDILSKQKGKQGVFRFLWDAMGREFPHLKIENPNENFKNSTSILNSLNEEQVLLIGFLLADIIEGQSIILEFLLNHFSKQDKISYKNLLHDVKQFGLGKYKRGEIHFAESINKYTFVEMIEVLLKNNIISSFFMNNTRMIQINGNEKISKLEDELNERADIIKNLFLYLS